MSLGVARRGDYCSGHDCFPARRTDQGSPDTFANGLGIHRQRDEWVVHCCQIGRQLVCHSGFLSQGSPTVYVNGLQMGRKNDVISCGSRVNSCSPDVFAGG